MRYLVSILLMVFSISILSADFLEELVKSGILPGDFEPTSTPTASEVALYIYKLNEKIEVQFEDVKKQIESLFNSLSEGMDDFGKKLDSLNNRLTLVESKYTYMEKDLSELKKEVSEFKDQLHEVYSIVSVATDLTYFGKTLKSLEARIGIIEGKYVDLVAEMKSLKSAGGLEDLEKKLTGLEGVVKGKMVDFESRLSDLNTKLSSLEKKVEVLNSKLEEFDTRDAKISEIVEKLSSNDEILYRNVKSIQASLTVLESYVSNSPDVRKLKTELETVKITMWMAVIMGMLGVIASIVVLALR